MKTALIKDITKEITKTFARFISIFLIVAIGVAFFAGIKASAPNMKNTADIYYDEYNLMDLRVLSTLGITDDDITEITKIDGIKEVQPAYFTDVVTNLGSSEFVFRIHSLPDEKVLNGDENFINRPKLLEGRYPQKSGECIIEQSNLIKTGLKIGDTITVSSGTTDDVLETIKTDTFTVVGTAISPYYLTFDKDTCTIGSGKVNFFMMVLESDFVMPVYIEALITVDDAIDLNCYSSKYEKLIDAVENKLNNLGGERCDIRLEEVKAMANEKLDEAKAELATQEEAFNTKIAEAEAKLEEANNQLVEGRAKLETEKANYQTRIAEAEKEIAEGEATLKTSQKQYDAGVEAYNKAMAQYGDQLDELDNTVTTLEKIKSQTLNQIKTLNKILATNENLTDSEREALMNQVNTLQATFNEATKGIDQLSALNAYVKKSISTSESQLASAKKQLNDAKNQLASAKATLASEKAKAQAAFAAAEKQIADGQAQYDAGKLEYETQKAEGEAKLKDANIQVIKAENEIERISKPTWYVLDRSKLMSYVDYEMTADRMDAIAKIFPVFFFLVAALVCLTTMTRMVDEQRGIIGTYKALGYSNVAIAAKYVVYAAIASGLGGIIGVVIGVNVFPQIIFNAWSMMYTLPDMVATSQIPLMIFSVFIGVAVTTLASYFACKKELIETPSMLMRPKAPKVGKSVFLERIPFIWKRLTFTKKVTVRNIFRYKKRFFMTIIGIAGCSALLVAGFGIDNTIGKIIDNQFSKIFKYDMSVKFNPNFDEAELIETCNEISANEKVAGTLKVSEFSASFTVDNSDAESVTLIVPTETEEFNAYVNLLSRKSQKPVELSNDGIVITEKLAKELDVKVGDAVSVDIGDGISKKIPVTGIAENYIFHYAYMSPEAYNTIFRMSAAYNALLIKIDNTNSAFENQFGSELISKESVSSVSYFSATKDKFQDTIKSLNSIVIVIIVCAALLAFVVLYNLTNVNISERIREIATLKVLGFYDREVSAYVYRENIILTMIGAAIGLVFGIALHRVIMTTIEQDGIMFGNYINWTTYIIAFVMTNCFGLLVNLAMYNKLKKIPMVESLKSVE